VQGLSVRPRFGGNSTAAAAAAAAAPQAGRQAGRQYLQYHRPLNGAIICDPLHAAIASSSTAQVSSLAAPGVAAAVKDPHSAVAGGRDPRHLPHNSLRARRLQAAKQQAAE
jgi:hypothetical protein